VRAEPYGAERARPFFEGLLPDGLRRERIARELGLEPADSLGLLAELGRDCPGAVVVLPAGREPPAPASVSPAWLADDELEELLAVPPPRLFDPGNEPRMRFSLPGERHKLALVRDERNDRWAWPQAGLPSTHIVKPETGEYPDFVVNRVACTAALREMGLPVAPLELATIAGSPCAVSRRFDRSGAGLAATRRHHETIWQAAGLPSEALLVEPRMDRPGFVASADLLREIGGEAAVETLFKVGFSNFLLGNCADDIVARCDLHGRNASVLLDGGPEAETIFYGIASTDAYESDKNTTRTLPEWVEHTSGYIGLLRIGLECRYEPQPALSLAMKTSRSLGERLAKVAERAVEEGWFRPVIDEIALVVANRTVQLFEDLQDVVHEPDGRTLREAGGYR
jgi:serine/threonine-protein kinase HipA